MKYANVSNALSPPMNNTFMQLFELCDIEETYGLGNYKLQNTFRAISIF